MFNQGLHQESQIAMLVGAVLLLLISQAQSAFIGHTYVKVAEENYSFPSVRCEFYSPVHWPVHATTYVQMCVVQDCFMFALNISGCAVCHNMKTGVGNVLDLQTLSAVFKRREFICMILCELSDCFID